MSRKIPTALLQLRYQKVRLLVALAGVIFSVVIIFVQLGIRDALFDSAVRFHQSLNGDYFLISPRSTALIAMESFPEKRLSQVLAFAEVEYVSPIYIDQGQWRNPQTRNSWRNIFVIGFDLRYSVLDLPGAIANQDKLRIPDTILFDAASRLEFGPVVSIFEREGSVTTEIGSQGFNRQVTVVGLFNLGTSFGADGNIITSHLNFLRIFPTRPKEHINIGVIKLKQNTDLARFARQLTNFLPDDVKVLSKSDFIKFEQNYWQSSTAIGFIFNLSVALGIIVGIVVVYQILYSNVTEHLSEYATLKAMGYRHGYLLSLVLQQALAIALMGYFPGFCIAVIQYQFARQATHLPIAMNFWRAVWVLMATVAMCFISGATAMTKLKDADPADIF